MLYDAATVNIARKPDQVNSDVGAAPPPACPTSTPMVSTTQKGIETTKSTWKTRCSQSWP